MRNLLVSSTLPLLLLTTTITLVQATETMTVVVTVTTTSTQPTSYADRTTFQDAMLTTTNTYRAAHNASILTWNKTLADYAQDWAEGCKWEHSHGPYGENLAFGYSNATASVEAWGNESQYYDYERPTGFSEETGHFTQLVWRATTEVGCAAVDCGLTPGNENDGSYTRPQGWYVVCEYAPAGNVVGATKALGDNAYFKVNVQPTSTYSGPTTTTATTTGSGTGTAEGVAGGRVGGNNDIRVWGLVVVGFVYYLA